LQPNATANTIKNNVGSSIRGTGQARNIVIDARGSGLSKSNAMKGMDNAFKYSRRKLDNISVIGDKYFIGRGI